MALRPDAPLIRHLAEAHSPAVARAMQALPYIQLPGEGFAEYLNDAGAELVAATPQLPALPWPDAVYDFQQGRAAITARVDAHLRTVVLGSQDVALPPILADRGQCWIRICTLARYLAAPQLAPWLAGPVDLLAPFRARPDAWIVTEAWEANTPRPDGSYGFPNYPDVALAPLAALWDSARAAYLYPNPLCRVERAYGAGFCNLHRCRLPNGDDRRYPCFGSGMVMDVGKRLATLMLAYLIQSREYLVEQQPIVAATLRTQRQIQRGEKPWTNLALPRYILIDPLRVRDYGHPSATRNESDGSTVRPHQRRGHWRALTDERFSRDEAGTIRRVWVRPAWIGETAWEAGGQRYRVVAPPAAQMAKTNVLTE